MGKFPWLAANAPARIPAAERARDWLRLVALLLVVLYCLSIPGIVLALIAIPSRFLVVLALAAAAAVGLWWIQAPLKGLDAPRSSGGRSLRPDDPERPPAARPFCPSRRPFSPST